MAEFSLLMLLVQPPSKMPHGVSYSGGVMADGRLFKS
jgi:hypothetical protein